MNVKVCPAKILLMLPKYFRVIQFCSEIILPMDHYRYRSAIVAHSIFAFLWASTQCTTVAIFMVPPHHEKKPNGQVGYGTMSFIWKKQGRTNKHAIVGYGRTCCTSDTGPVANEMLNGRTCRILQVVTIISSVTDDLEACGNMFYQNCIEKLWFNGVFNENFTFPSLVQIPKSQFYISVIPFE